jgi:hypothetical protein
MSSGLSETDSFDHEISANLVGVLAEIISNVTDGREVIRELLSNACAREVGATQITVSVYESDFGLAIAVEDNGVGMDYTGDRDRPGRLDRFLDIAYSAQAGLTADEFSYKGLGAKLLHNSRRAVIETSTGGGQAYRVEIRDPKKAIEQERKVRKPSILSIKEKRERGTKIEVLGYGGWSQLPEDFEGDELEHYLRYFTAVGFTRPRQLPNITLRVKGKSRVVPTGFPFIKPPEKGSKRTFVLSEPLRLSREGVTVEVRGGGTVDTGANDLVEGTGGTMVAWRGIPYFWLDGRHFEKVLGVQAEFLRFVVDSDDIQLNTSRTELDYGHRSTDTFLDLVNEAAGQIKAMPSFKEFDTVWHQDSDEKAAKMMDKAKENLRKSQMVLLDGRPIHAEPKNETDTAAILWKLEGADKVPFHIFRTLRYAGSPKGIDLLIDFQESPESERFNPVYCEVEFRFSSFYKHKHNLAQTRMCICWEYDRPGFSDAQIQSVEGKPWKILLTVGEHQLTVYRLSRFPHISVGKAPEEP